MNEELVGAPFQAFSMSCLLQGLPQVMWLAVTYRNYISMGLGMPVGLHVCVLVYAHSKLRLATALACYLAAIFQAWQMWPLVAQCYGLAGQFLGKLEVNAEKTVREHQITLCEQLQAPHWVPEAMIWAVDSEIGGPVVLCSFCYFKYYKLQFPIHISVIARPTPAAQIMKAISQPGEEGYVCSLNWYQEKPWIVMPQPGHIDVYGHTPMVGQRLMAMGQQTGPVSVSWYFQEGLDPEILDDADLLMSMLVKNPSHNWPMLPMAKRKHKALAELAATRAGWLLRLMGDFRSDKAIVEAAVKSHPAAIADISDAKLLGDIVVQDPVLYWPFLLPGQADNMALAMHAVVANGLVLEFMPDGFKKNKDIVMAAVRSNPTAIQWAAP